MSLPSFSNEEENEVSNGDKVIAWNFSNNEIIWSGCKIVS